MNNKKVIIDSNGIQNSLLKDFNDIKEKLNDCNTSLAKIQDYGCIEFTGQIEYLKNKISYHTNTCNQYRNKLENIKKKSDEISSIHTKKISSIEKINANQLLKK